VVCATARCAGLSGTPGHASKICDGFSDEPLARGSLGRIGQGRHVDDLKMTRTSRDDLRESGGDGCRAAGHHGVQKRRIRYGTGKSQGIVTPEP